MSKNSVMKHNLETLEQLVEAGELASHHGDLQVDYSKSNRITSVYAIGDNCKYSIAFAVHGGFENQNSDADFIACCFNARQSLRAVLNYVQELLANNDRLRKSLEFIRDNSDETLANNVAFKALTEGSE